VVVLIGSTMTGTAHAGHPHWVTHGPPGGVTAIALAPSAPDTLYAGAGGGVFKTTDGARTWRPASQGLPVNQDVPALAVDPTDPDIAYVGTIGHGVYSTDDGGATWRAANKGLYEQAFVWALAVAPLQPSTVYAGLQSALGTVLFKTTDGGRHWTDVTGSVPSGFVSGLVVDPTRPDVVYAATHGPSQVYKTTDGGRTWKPRGEGFPRIASASDIAIDPVRPDTLYVAAPAPKGGLFKTTDGARTWSRVGDPVGSGDISNVAVGADSTVYAGGDGLYRSRDGGETWTLVQSHDFDEYRWIPKTVIDPGKPSTVYAAASLRPAVVKSTDGGDTWRPATDGLAGDGGFSLAFDPTDPDVIYTSGGDLYKTTDRGLNWRRITPDLSTLPGFSSMAVDPAAPATVYAGVFFPGGLFKSTDKGGTWAEADTGMGRAPLSELAFDAARPARVYAATYFGVYVSDDRAATWTKTSFPEGYVLTLAVDPLDSNTVYGGVGGDDFSGGALFESMDGGTTWAEAFRLPLTWSVADIAFDPADPDLVYLAAYSYQEYPHGWVYRSEDGGVTWRGYRAGLDERAVTRIAPDPQKPGTVYAGTKVGGVFISTDWGRAWRPISDGLLNTNINDVKVDPSGHVWAGSWGVYDLQP